MPWPGRCQPHVGLRMRRMRARRAAAKILPVTPAPPKAKGREVDPGQIDLEEWLAHPT